MKPDGVEIPSCKYISICPDGKLRQFTDTTVGPHLSEISTLLENIAPY